ncbi:MAG: serine/threonine protein kinase [Acidobacteriota bacterium]|nr:serine/threonine protein kinase [Acidobacteriota bacterium]
MKRALAWTDLELHEQLGEGQSGTVYKAVVKRGSGGLAAGTEVAVKRYRAWVLDEPGQMERIFREVEAGRRIKHKNVVRIHGAILDERGHPALVMQFCGGPTLETFLAANRLTTAQGLEILAGVARGVAALHAEGITHRDLKPANIIMAEEGPTIADFGVIRSDSLPEQTTSGAFLGTIRYAAPEYLFGAQYDSRIDLYSFGAIAYEIVMGRAIFPSEQHWAKVVAAKAMSLGMNRSDLREIVRRDNWPTAYFVDYVLRHTLTQLPSERTLDLPRFANAIEQRLWDGRFAVHDGTIDSGRSSFEGRYATADDAAAELRARLSAFDLYDVLSVIEEHYWEEDIPFRRLPNRVRHWLISRGIATIMPPEAGHVGSRQVFDPAVREAFAFGLLAS